uniref:Uncharacterized protein n=1 Tax=Steinernema glaseri TaxID=37863 RepID=A0A1I7Y4E2_9BILA
MSTLQSDLGNQFPPACSSWRTVRCFDSPFVLLLVSLLLGLSLVRGSDRLPNIGPPIAVNPKRTAPRECYGNAPETDGLEGPAASATCRGARGRPGTDLRRRQGADLRVQMGVPRERPSEL